MLKKASLLLLAFMLVFSLAACSGDNNKESEPQNTGGSTPVSGSEGDDSEAGGDITPEPGAKLVIWDGNDGAPFLREAVKDFTAKYNIPVEVQEQGAPEQMSKMLTDGPAGTGPDLLTLPHDNLSKAIASGFVLPNDYYEEETKAEYLESAVNAVTSNGILYGYPRNMETYVMYYNKSLVDESKLGTWKDVIEFSKGFNDVKNKKYGFMVMLNDFFFDYLFISGGGGYVFGGNGTDPSDIGLNSEGAVKGMEFFQSLKEILPLQAADVTTDIKTSLFQDGKLAINIDGVWNMGNFSKLPFEVGVVPLPKFDDGTTPKSFSTVKAYYVSAFSKYPNAAKLLSRYLTSKDVLLDSFEANGFLPVRKGLENEAVITSSPMVPGTLKQFEYAEPMPSIIEMSAVWTPMVSALELIWEGKDPKSTLDQAVDAINVGIKDLNK